MSDVNTEFRDWLLRNQHYVHRFENGMIQDVTRHYDEASKIISDKIGNLQSWYDEARYKTAYTMDWRMQRLQKMLDETEMVMNTASNGAISGLSTDLREYASTYAGALEGELADAFGKASVVLNRIPAAQVFAMVEQPMLGETFGQRILWGDAQSVRLIRDRLTQAVIAGEDMATARNYLLGRGFRMHGKLGDMTRNRADMIARTEIQRVSNAVSRAAYDANQDVIKGLQYLATLDRRTCLLPDSKVLTDKGEKKIEDIEIGNLILTHTGKYKKVMKKMRQVKKRFLRIKLSNGRTLKLTPDHEILSDGKWIIANELKKGDLLDGLSMA